MTDYDRDQGKNPFPEVGIVYFSTLNFKALKTSVRYFEILSRAGLQEVTFVM